MTIEQVCIEDIGKGQPIQYSGAASEAVKKRRKVQVACIPCRKAHISCDEFRPCKRCESKHFDCVDHVRRPAGLKAALNNAKSDPHEPANEPPSPTATNSLFLTPTKFVPLEDPNFFFDGLSLTPFDSHENVAFPKCFESAQDFGGAAYPISGNMNLCHSAGLPSCLDCSFNIHLQPNAKHTIRPIEDAVSFDSGTFTNLKPDPLAAGLKPEPIDYQSKKPIQKVLRRMDVPESMVAHIEYLVKSLAPRSINCGTTLLFDYIPIFECALPSSPSCIFSPSGIIFTSNAAFARLIKYEYPTQWAADFCIYSLFDMSSILTILDLANTYGDDSSTRFGRCCISNALGVKHLCAASISTHIEANILWIVAQFIPI